MGVGWGDGRAGKLSDSGTEAAMYTEMGRECKEKGGRDALTEVESTLQLSRHPQPPWNEGFYLFYSSSVSFSVSISFPAVWLHSLLTFISTSHYFNPAFNILIFSTFTQGYRYKNNKPEQKKKQNAWSHLLICIYYPLLSTGPFLQLKIWKIKQHICSAVLWLMVHENWKRKSTTL